MGVDAEQRELRKRGLKRCKGPCGEIKSYEHGFHHRAGKLANGDIRYYPEAMCTTCTIKRSAAYKEQLRRDGIYDQKRQQWRAGMDLESHRAYQRDWSRMNDLLTGKVKNPRGPIKKYRTQPRVMVEPDSFLEWLGAISPYLTENEARQIRRLVSGEIELLELGFIDTIMTRVGEHDQFSVLYQS